MWESFEQFFLLNFSSLAKVFIWAAAVFPWKTAGGSVSIWCIFLQWEPARTGAAWVLLNVAFGNSVHMESVHRHLLSLRVSLWIDGVLFPWKGFQWHPHTGSHHPAIVGVMAPTPSTQTHWPAHNTLFVSVCLSLFSLLPTPFPCVPPTPPKCCATIPAFTVLGAFYMPRKHCICQRTQPQCILFYLDSYPWWFLLIPPSLMIVGPVSVLLHLYISQSFLTFWPMPVSYLRGISNRTHSKFFFSFPPCMGQWWLFPSKCKPNPCCLLKFLLFVAFQT